MASDNLTDIQELTKMYEKSLVGLYKSSLKVIPYIDYLLKFEEPASDSVKRLQEVRLIVMKYKEEINGFLAGEPSADGEGKKSKKNEDEE